MSRVDVLIGTAADLFSGLSVTVRPSAVATVAGVGAAGPLAANSVIAHPATVGCVAGIPTPLIWPPTQTSVGYAPTGVVLRDFLPADGSDIVLSTPNATYDGYRFHGRVTVNATGVTLTRCLIRPDIAPVDNVPAGTHWNDPIFYAKFPTTAIDTEIDGNQLGFDTLVGWNNYTLRRCWVHGGGDGIRMGTTGGFYPGNNIFVYDSYIGPQFQVTAATHNDAIQSTGGTGPVVVDGCTIDAATSNLGNAGAGFLLKADFYDVSNVTINHNYFKSGNIGLQPVDGTSFRVLGGVRITNNVFNKSGFVDWTGNGDAYGYEAVVAATVLATGDQSAWLYSTGNRYADGSVLNQVAGASGTKIHALPDMANGVIAGVQSVGAVAGIPAAGVKTMPIIARAVAAIASTPAPVVSAGGGLAVTHGSQLTVNHVGPWTLQGVAKNSEQLQTVTDPVRGYYRMDTPAEFAPTTAWPSNANDSNPSVLNNPNLHGGVVTGSPVTIDGYVIPVGTYIAQFRSFGVGNSGGPTTTTKVMFRGCRFRFWDDPANIGLFNNGYSPSSNNIFLHYCDIGGPSSSPPLGQVGVMCTLRGGGGHRVLRCYCTYAQGGPTPFADNCEFTENWVDNLMFWYGESGWSGLFDSSAAHMNGIKYEDLVTTFTIQRNHIFMRSPDGDTGGVGTAAGQPGYGTQPGQTGYGAGSNPGRVVGQTDTMFMQDKNGPWVNGPYKMIDNYVGGAGYSVYLTRLAASTNVIFTGNRCTTQFWPQGGQFGPVAAGGVFDGVNGSVVSDNRWYDDYGSVPGGDVEGACALANRQYPNGDGPRKGTLFFGSR